MPKDKGYGQSAAKHNMKYKGGMKGGKVMGHEKKPMKCDPLMAQKSDMGKVQKRPMDYRGTPKQAFEYKY